MKIYPLLLGALFIQVTAPWAQARPQPTPPPSGVVIHLFGPDSVMSHVLPGAPGGANETAGIAQPGGQEANPNGSGDTNSGASQPSNYVEPSMGDILHQLFVTGDPNAPPKPSAGRTSERPW